jgi:hypothetical protein
VRSANKYVPSHKSLSENCRARHPTWQHVDPSVTMCTPRRMSNKLLHSSTRAMYWSLSSQCVKGKGKLVPVLSLPEHHAIKAYWGVEVQLHKFLKLDPRWMWVVSFTPQPPYSQGKSPWYPLGSSKSQFGCGGAFINSKKKGKVVPVL